mmetsp:Transcript_31769/g.59201  ORF Transcript_31769/g.59201 Transcript_31769/m.59201 type:complete len:242 (-) Transcript_31769:174-899(-)
MSQPPKHINRKHIESPLNQAGAIVLEKAARKVMGEKLGAKLDLALPHKWKGTLVAEYGGTREEVPVEAIVKAACTELKTEFKGEAVDLGDMVVTALKVKKKKLELSYAVADAAALQRKKAENAAKAGPKPGKKSKSKNKGKKAAEAKLSLKPLSIHQEAMKDVLQSTLECLKANGIALPEGKAMGSLKESLASAIQPSILTLQNRAYSQGMGSAMGASPLPSYNLYEKPVDKKEAIVAAAP